MKLFTIFLFICFNCFSQSDKIKITTVDPFFNDVDEIRIKELIKNKILNDSLYVVKKYLNQKTGQLNEKGDKKFSRINKKIYKSYFRDYLYLQDVNYNNYVYVLYFTTNGTKEFIWDIIRWSKEDWNNSKTLKKNKIRGNKGLKKILSSYDMLPINFDEAKIFIKNDFLILDRGNLFHSLYDLKSERIIINDVNKLRSSESENRQKAIEWVKLNLHDKIEKILNEKRK